MPERIEKKPIIDEMQECYLDYAMSVIVSRALPDVRDGLKPVQRRILYAMHTMGLKPSGGFRKSATVVGEVIGKYHPHGDIPIYDAMAHLAQKFAMRYPLVNGQGNWGSLDGDKPAAMRYTEAKLATISEALLQDIEKNTVNFVENYDRTKKMPAVLPASVPQLLLNGSLGIAVGMATSIPPHNLGELIDGCCLLIDDPQTTNEDLMEIVKGPDFPGGGIIYDRPQIIQAYATGHGPIVCRAKAEINEGRKGKWQIIISEIPFQVNKATLLEKLALLVKQKKIEGIKNIRDESDKKGLRIVIDLKPDTTPQQTLNQLFKLTELQKTFNLNLLALEEGIQPQVFSLKGVLEAFLKHRHQVVIRRAQFALDAAKARAHILEGLSKALDRIDEVITTIRSSQNRDSAHKNLVKKFAFSDAQAEAILEMRLQTLAGLERKKIKDELAEKLKLIAELIELLASPQKIDAMIKNELSLTKEKFADARRTKVIKGKINALSDEDLIQEQNIIITLTKDGYIKRTTPKTYRSQKKGGKGVSGMATKPGDIVKHCVNCSSLAQLLLFTDQGHVFKIPAYTIPEAQRVAKGKSILNLVQLTSQEKITAILPLDKNQTNGFLVMATKNGIIKKTSIDEFNNLHRSGMKAINLSSGDRLGWAEISSGKDEILLITSRGQAIRFKENDLRPLGRATAGVHGISLTKDDKVIGMGIIEKNPIKEVASKNGNNQIATTPENKSNKNYLLVVTEKGIGKRSALGYYRLQHRGGQGIKTIRIAAKTGPIIYAQIVPEQEKDLIVISQKGQVIRLALGSVPKQNRITQGVRIMKLAENDKVASVTCV